MKTRDLVKKLEQNGWTLKRHGGNHDVYIKNGKRESVPRHSETDEDLANAIIRRRRLK
jgi:mRNA interferase HicA